MSILEGHLIFYGSANMQDTDAGTQGGAKDLTKRVVFEDIAPAGQLEIVSSAAGDTTQSVAITGRDSSGAKISESPTLSGTTPVTTTETDWERILKAVKSATTVGDVALMETTPERANTALDGAAETATVMAWIDLDAGASAANDFYNNMVIRTTGGTGPNQIRRIIDYDGTGKRAFVFPDWAVVPDATTTFDIAQGMVFEKTPNEVLEIRRPFFDVAADAPGGSARDFYEKVFVENAHASLTLTNGVVSEQADPSTKIDFWLPGTLDDSGTATDRTTAPGGSSFDSADKNVANSQNLTNGAAQGCWVHLALAAGDAADDTFYTPRITGNTT